MNKLRELSQADKTAGVEIAEAIQARIDARQSQQSSEPEPEAIPSPPPPGPGEPQP